MSRIRYSSAAVALCFLALTGCAQSDVIQTGTTVGERDYEPVEPIDETPATAEDDFIDFIKKNAPVGYAASEDREIIAYGYGICKLLDGGATVVEIVSRTLDLATEDGQAFVEMAQVSVVGAPQTLCPEHEESVRAQLEEFS